MARVALEKNTTVVIDGVLYTKKYDNAPGSRSCFGCVFSQQPNKRTCGFTSLNAGMANAAAVLCNEFAEELDVDDSLRGFVRKRVQTS
jgi:hypothetical protein